MKIIECTQGEPAWFTAKLGLPSSSNAGRIITPKTMKPSAAADKYLCQLVAERLLGVNLNVEATPFMERGALFEQRAVSAYEFVREVDTQRVGLCLSDNGAICCSVDRFVGEAGILEIKVLEAANHIGALLGMKEDDHKAQCQFQLMVTGRAWVDLYCWNPEIRPALVRYERDEAFIDKLAKGTAELLTRIDEALEIVRPANTAAA